VKLPLPADAYIPSQERQRNEQLERADQQNVKRGTDIYLNALDANGRRPRLILSDDDGVKWVLTVATDGTLGTTAL
jgi:hypothetical protein